MSAKTKQRKKDDGRPRHQFKLGNTHGKRWQPGESGNPEGRPVTSAVTVTRDLQRTIRELLSECDDPRTGKSHLRVLLETACRRAKSGSSRDLQTLLAYAFGSPSQTNTNINLNSELSQEEKLRAMTEEQLTERLTELLNARGAAN